MVRGNSKVYPLSVISEETYNQISPKLRILEQQTQTTIRYNFAERYFDITGQEQQNCIKVEKAIYQALLPKLDEYIDQNFLSGTYVDLSMLRNTYNDQNIKPATPQQVVVRRGSLTAVEDGMSSSDEDEEDQVQEKPEESFKNRSEDNEYTDYPDQTVGKDFVISPLIHHVNSLLIGPLQHNMQRADYIAIISKLTDTTCTLDERTIRIVGTFRNVKEAYEKFSVIQKTWLGLARKRSVACIHYHKSSGPYKLYFCKLRQYRYKALVHTQTVDRFAMMNTHVILPSFMDPNTLEFAQPVDFIREIPIQHEPSTYQRLPNYPPAQPSYQRPANVYQPLPPSQNGYARPESHYSPPSHPMRPQAYHRESPLRKSAPATPQLLSATSPLHSPVPSTSISSNIDNNSSSDSITDVQTPDTQKYQQLGTWGLDRNFTSVYSVGDAEYLSSERLARAFTPPPRPLSTQSDYVESQEFPSLPIASTISRPTSSQSSYKPRLSKKNQQPARRVMRIVPQQKENSLSRAPCQSLLERVRERNYHLIKEGLTNGLEAVRGFKGEIVLSAKIGKVLWKVETPDVLNRLWESEDLTDIVMKELSTLPQFTDMTTRDENIINCMASNQIFDTSAPSRRAIYEFHCLARNSPCLPYKPVVVHMNQGVIDVRKVVTNETTVTEVNWVSLDRKYDFQLALAARELVRCNAKPYTTFIKWVSVRLETRHMTFENIPNFLEVKEIIFKQTTRYRVFPFVIEVTRVEKVPMKPSQTTKKIEAYPGTGEAWYDFEIINTLHDAPFKSNLDLGVGEEASWTVEDILQTQTSADTIHSYVSFLIQIIEKIEKQLNTSRPAE